MQKKVLLRNPISSLVVKCHTPPRDGTSGDGYSRPPMGYNGITVRKWVARILLECFLVVSIKPCVESQSRIGVVQLRNMLHKN